MASMANSVFPLVHGSHMRVIYLAQAVGRSSDGEELNGLVPICQLLTSDKDSQKIVR